MRARTGTGNGWAACAAGHRHWGRFGAAGLLVADAPAANRVLLQLRAAWTHEGGTWSIPGGARDRDETVLHAALIEAEEEAGIAAGSVAPTGVLVDDHGGWSYTTVAAVATAEVAAAPLRECDAIRWIDVSDVEQLPLHRGFATSWPQLRTLPAPLTVLVDAANVVGSTPDGWWRDRAAATRRLLDRLAPLPQLGVPAAALPSEIAAGGLTALLPALRVVLEGKARRAVDSAAQRAGLSVVSAPGSGDDEIVAQASAALAAGRQVVAVSADRELRRRLPAGAVACGPSWLRDVLARQPHLLL